MMRHIFTLQMLGIGCLVFLSSSLRAAEAMKAVPAADATAWTIHYRNQPVMVYQFSPTQYKPYVKELRTLKGLNVLRDAPHDHLHHHALMYAIRVNDVNFWEETAGSGVQRVVQTSAPAVTSEAGSAKAVLRQKLVWVPAEAAFLPATNLPSLLLEERTLTLTITEASQEVALLWESRFTVGARTNTVVLGGSSYFGLGMRFPAEFDPLAKHFTPQGPMSLENNRQDVAAYPWAAVSFEIPGNPATVAVSGSRANRGGAPVFFSMRTPFAYLSATQGLEKQPITLRQGETMDISYLVTVYPSVKTAEALNQRFHTYAGLPR